MESVFKSNWVHIGHKSALCEPNAFFTGQFNGMQYLVCLNDQGTIKAFWNVNPQTNSKLVLK